MDLQILTHHDREVFEGLCKSNLYELAIKLAEKHQDVPSIVCSVHSSRLSAQEKKVKDDYYLDTFRYDYFGCLMQYLDDQKESEETNREMLSLCSSYSTYADTFFKKGHVKIAWIYHLRLKQYEKAGQSLSLRLSDENLCREKRKEYLGWMKSINAAIECRNHNNSST